MHLDGALGRLEVPRPPHVGVELDRDGAAHVDLRILGHAHLCAGSAVSGHLALGQRKNVDAGHLADVSIHWDEQVAKREHAAGHHGELAHHAEVLAMQPLTDAHERPGVLGDRLAGGIETTFGSAAEHHHAHQETDEEQDGDRRQRQPHAAVVLLLLGCHGHGCAAS